MFSNLEYSVMICDYTYNIDREVHELHLR